MKLFFDFDDVLFNTKKFKEDCYAIFKKKGVSRSFFDECYYDPLDTASIRVYDVVKHIERICQKTNRDCSILEHAVAIFVADTKKYVFADVSDVLSGFHKKDLDILSFSKTNFQKAKINGSGITSFFNKITIINSLKGEEMAKIIKKEKLGSSEEVYFIDDRVEQIEDVKKRCPQVKTILCVRPEGRYRDRKNKHCDYRITSLREIKKIIRTNKKDGKQGN
jgi:FMN phosphatase YigB (HAD superfamily)